MLLTQTASSAPNFILVGAGLVWQTLPAGWVNTFESHYRRGDRAADRLLNPRAAQLWEQ